jgi:hypothetical protein
MPPAVKLRKGKRQRFYARNSLNTTLPWWVKRLMPSFPAGNAANSLYRDHIRPTLTNVADEVCATVARLFVYVGVLALFGILGLHALDKLRMDMAADPAPGASWSVADRSYPAFALSPLSLADKSDKSDAYVIFRHPGGGRKDVLRWSAPGDRPAAELEIYRPGSEYPAVGVARADLATRMISPGVDLEAAGVIESKFGSVVLLRQAGAREGMGACLGFLKRIDDPALQISGWSCRGLSLPSRRADIDCMLNRLTPLASGNEPKLAELFANAELRRTNCGPAQGPTGGTSGGTADWIVATENPRLRGAL